MASERTSHLTSIFSQPVGREGEEKGKPDLKRESFRERLHLLSKFPGDRTGGFKRSKRKSSSSRQGFRIETGVGEFRQAPRGRSSPTLVTFYPKGCVVVVFPKGNVWLLFEP